ncbi:hypothetical protein DP923_12600 [Pontibacter arcticus]|uniref:Secretion system C-terminal sorting domain-containing protein n=2 Tax=Pontibacter arcticus TaxID=2080288 RepID=A0A364REB3_9BACT|nr:hypothetical protein DP923_12600 [Pontibacter arcticus]
MPSGTFLAQNGTITVSNSTTLVEGIYPLTISLTDRSGGISTVNILIRIRGNSPTITPLPVELVYFRASAGKGKVELQWLTASEKDNDRFEVERSSDSKAFEKLGTVAGKGNSNVSNKYSFTDKSPLVGTAYYRLKQVDSDGSIAYSNVITLETEGNTASDLVMKVYPNPFISQISISLVAQQQESAQLILLDLQGREVIRKTIELEKGENQLELPLQKLANGMYMLKVVSGSIKAATKIIKNR